MSFGSASKKVAVISSKPVKLAGTGARVTSLTWGRLRPEDGITDYDILILNLPKGHDIESTDWSSFHSTLKVDGLIDLFIRGSVIFVVGDPRFMYSVNGRQRPFLNWTGMEFTWRCTRGDQIEKAAGDNGSGVDKYADHIHQWDYSLRAVEPFGDTQRILASRIEKCIGKFEPKFVCEHLYRTLHKDGIISFIQFNLINPDAKFSLPAIPRHRPHLGGLLLLPATHMSASDTISLILSEICSVSVGAPEPDWASAMTVPGQEILDCKIRETMVTIQESQSELESLKASRKECRSSLRLLYSKGNDLETAARAALAELDAELTAKNDDIGDDICFSFQVGGSQYFSTAEVKGTSRKSFNEQGIRQLADWKNRRIDLEPRDYKGIFIGNSSIESVPEDRPDPFSDGFQKRLQALQFVAILSSDLYTLLMANRAGKLDTDAMWRSILRTNGVLDIKSLIE